jgi:hypothetical protein
MLVEDQKSRARAREPEVEAPPSPPAPDPSPSSGPSVGSGAEAARRNRSRALLSFATIMVTVVFSYVALKGIRPAAVWHALSTSDYWWLLPALVVFGGRRP